MFFLGYDISGLIFFLKILGAFLSTFFFIGIIISYRGLSEVARIKAMKRAEHFSLFNEDLVEEDIHQERWNAIKKMFHSNNPSDWKMAVIDADAMLEDIFTHLGFQGVTFGDKLKSATRESFPLIDDAWYVHKIRNNLAHQGFQFQLSERDYHQIYKIYENIFYRTGFIH